MPAAFEALHAFFYSTTWPMVCVICGEPDPLHMHEVISHMVQQLTAQLTAGACLAQLCEFEAATRAGLSTLGTNSTQFSYCQDSRSAGTFGLVVSCMDKAVKVNPRAVQSHAVPWRH